MIASLLWPGVLSRPAKTTFHVQRRGDVATWLLALFAFLAFIAALLAYREQQKASAALAAQAESQRKAFEDQKAANAAQAEVLTAQLADLTRQAKAAARSQAVLVTLRRRKWTLAVPGLRDHQGAPVDEAVVENESSLPIGNVACRIRASQDGPLHPPRPDRPVALGGNQPDDRARGGVVQGRAWHC